MQFEFPPPPPLYYTANVAADPFSYPVLHFLPPVINPPQVYYQPQPVIYSPPFENASPLSPLERAQFMQKTSHTNTYQSPQQRRYSSSSHRYNSNHNNGSPNASPRPNTYPNHGNNTNTTNNYNNNNPVKVMHIPYLLINTVEQCRTIVEKLLPYTKLAIDIEGISLSRTGRICIIQIATTTDVYLFDIETLKHSAFHEGKLKELLESVNIDKLFFDARKDAEALFYQYQIQMVNIFDLQILYTKYRQQQGGGVGVGYDPSLHGFLPGLKTCFKDHQLFTKKESLKYEKIKEKGHEIFSPQFGGSFDHWAIRPLHPDLIHYCICDVMLLYTIYSKCCHLVTHERLQELSARRIQEIIQTEVPYAEDHAIWRMINF